MNPASPEAVRRSRRQLVMIAAVFLAPLMIAAAVGLSGWMPGTRGHGQPIEPQRSFLDVALTLEDGSQHEWRNAVEPLFTLLALPGVDCAAKCKQQLQMMRNARHTLNRLSHRVRLVYVGDRSPVADTLGPEWKVGTDTANALAEFRPVTPDSVAAVLVQSNGTALSLYPDGFNPSGLRLDLKKVVK